MGKLRDYVIATKTITGPGGEFSVRGINTNDIAAIAAAHGPELTALFSTIMKDKKSGQNAKFTDAFKPDQIKGVLAKLLPEFPEIASALVALAADDYSPEGLGIVMRMPLGVQIEALEAIFALTFGSEAELKKLLESITRMLSGLTDSVKQMTLLTSDLGTGAFAAE